MVLTIDLSPQQTRRLAERAEREGRSVSDVARDLLDESLDDAAADDAWATRAVADWEASDRSVRPIGEVWEELGL